MGESKHVRLRVGVIGLGRLWETRHKPSLARLQDRFRITAVYDQVYRRAEIEAAQLGCAACEGLAALVERPDVDVDLPVVAPVVRASSRAPGLRGGKAVYCGLPLAGDLAELESLAQPVERDRHRLHARVRPPVLSGDPAAQGAAGDLAGPATPDSGPFPALRLRPLRDARPDHPDLARAAVDRSGKLSASTGATFLLQSLPTSIHGTRCQVLPLRGRQTSEPDFESFVASFSGRAPRPRSVLAAITGPLGRSQPFLARRRASRSSPSAAPPGWRCPSESSGRTRAAPMKKAAARAHRRRRAQRPVPPPGHKGQSLAPTIRDALEIAQLVQDLESSQADGS